MKSHARQARLDWVIALNQGYTLTATMLRYLLVTKDDRHRVGSVAVGRSIPFVLFTGSIFGLPGRSTGQ
ncbi:hypothetical protein F4777DRAFT_535632 [Nemania sp. FL0916]|nr:hypothetical protein F4777DRAFT_535632 [Nemania sp. FL0916]